MKAILSIYAAVIGCTWVAFSANAAVRYVNVNHARPNPPYTNWATAANIIQDAIDVASPGDEVVVTNGVYETGGRVVSGSLTNRVAVTKALTLRSVNGPEVTVIRGDRVPGMDVAVRCVYLASNATLIGFTLTGGGSRTKADLSELSGGGAWCESPTAVITNCIITNNVATAFGGGVFGGTLNHCILAGNFTSGTSFWLGYGGGAVRATLYNCVIRGNSANGGGGVGDSTLSNCLLVENDAYYGGTASGFGGGAEGSRLTRCTLIGNRATRGGGGSAAGILNNCVVTGNSAGEGGGAFEGTLNNCIITGNSAGLAGGTFSGTLNNCIVYHNSAPVAANYSGDFPINYSCTTPLPTNGVGNITNAPVFIDPTAVDFRLQSGSPCINAGRTAYAPAGFDLDGNARIAGGTVDIGAYEFQSPQSVISYGWLQQNGLATDGSADSTDADGDGMTTFQEWRAGTNPFDEQSALRLLHPTRLPGALMVSWQSVSNRIYSLKRSAILGDSFGTVASNIVGQAGVTGYTDTNIAGAGPFIYRVNVEE